MNTNQDNKNLILGGSIFSLITGFGSLIFWTITLLGSSTLFWWFSDYGLKTLLFLIWASNVSSLVLSILCLVPATSSKKGLVMTTGIFNIVFGTIVGGVLLLIGASNMNVNNNTNQLNLNNQENIQPINVQVENKPVKKVEKTKEVERVKEIYSENKNLNNFNVTCKTKFNYKIALVLGLVLTMIGSAVWIGYTGYELDQALMPPSSHGWDWNSRLTYIVNTALRLITYSTLFILSIIGLITIKKEYLTINILCAATGIALVPMNYIAAIGGTIILLALVFNWVVNSKLNCKNNN
ncbi:hypothetical protein [Mycoplasma yeatsii]|uniref:Transmembrane protein n=1 Tax=Mycoplasma yeatsii TaxID=51365 RepID=A0ABU0NDY8_9MOLU|nr:hypothetical protein [Mycoplasma yeatsii]MDQ0567652.1 hypothetical protein [Mycoplasma yeatsii]